MKILSKSKAGRFNWILWRNTKESASLFDSTIGSWSPAQKLFVYWCSFYDNVYESIERPPDRVVEDDELLEIWLDKQSEKSKAYAEENWSKVAAIGDIKTAWDHPEVITFGGDYD
jgi:hypothetical protein